MKHLYEIFTYENKQSASLRQYNSGASFTLRDGIGLVTDGAIAIEAIDADKGTVITTRVAGEGEFLNLELLFNPSTGENQQYVIESKTASVSIIKASHLRSILALGDENTRLKMYEMIAKRLANQLLGVTETVTWLGTQKAQEKIKWSLSRLHETNNQDPHEITRLRLMSHTGVSDVTVTRSVAKLRKVKDLNSRDELLLAKIVGDRKSA